MLMELVVFIVKQYFILFLRVINFISRKQEFRSDELACLIASSTSGISGLQKIHSAAVAWTFYWNSEVAPVVSHNCLPAIAEGFKLFTQEQPLPLNSRPRSMKRKHPPRPAPWILTPLFLRASRPCNRLIHRKPIWTPVPLCPL
jgi:Zn-dependent protease with chaperone function